MPGQVSALPLGCLRMLCWRSQPRRCASVVAGGCWPALTAPSPAGAAAGRAKWPGFAELWAQLLAAWLPSTKPRWRNLRPALLPQGKWAFGAAGLQHPKHTGALGADEASADLRAEPGWAAPTWPSRVPLGAPRAPCPPKGRVVRGHPREGCVCRGVPRSPPHLGTSWGTSRVPAEPCRTPPQRTAGGEPGGPREASLLKSGCCIYFPLLAARRGSPSQPLIVVSAS